MLRVLDRPTGRLPRPWRTVVDWALTIAAAVAFVLAFEAEVAKAYRIPTSSMEPTLQCARPGFGCTASSSDRVIANRLAYRFSSPKRGQIVVFKAPNAAARECETGGTFVKRLIGLPGERISERHGYVYVDGRPMDEPYVKRSERDDETRSWPRVPPGRYFLMGDNRLHSCDSRDWGTVPRGNLIGPVVLTYWPPWRISFH
jgi:signal peptidase I